MASKSDPYSAKVPSDLAEEVDRRREREHPEPGETLSKTEAVTRALEEWAGKPTWREQAHTAAVNLCLLAVVAFITGETTDVLSIAEASMLSWVLLAVAAAAVALTEVLDIARQSRLASPLQTISLWRTER